MRGLILKKFSVLLFLLGSTGVLLAQNGVTCIDSLNQRHGGPGPSYQFYYASCWGYVAPDGHEYALMGCYSGTSIIDLDAAPLREVAYVAGVNSEWKEIKTWGHYAYAVSEGNMGLQIIDLKYLPDSAHLVRSVTSVGGKNITRSHTVSVADGYLYLNGCANASPGGAIILSLADPENPTFVGQYEPEYLHDVYVRRDTLYGAAINGGGVYIASLANKAAPTQIGHITYTGSGTHNTWASVSGRYLFTSDEVGTTPKSMKVWDLQNLPAVVQLTPFQPSPANTIHNVHGRGNYVYMSYYKAGAFVADVHDPTNIINAGTFNTYRGGGTSAQYAGCWGVYPYFPSGRWIGSDTQTGLYVFRFNGLVARTRSPLLAPTNNAIISTGATTTFRWRRATSMIEDPHYYKLHMWGPGVDTLISAADTSLAVPALPGFQNARLYNWHVWINDEFTSVSGRDTFHFSYGSQAGVGTDPSVPMQFTLFQNYPNPFNPSTTIAFDLPVDSRITLIVYDLLGEEVQSLVSGLVRAGHHVETFNAADLPSGVYICRLTAGPYSSAIKLVLLR
jgi:choice-of-anchor B domain-containing protein